MGQITSMFVRKFAEAAAPGDPARQGELCRGAGLGPQSPTDPDLMVRDTAFFAMLERIAEEDADGRSIAVRVGASMRCDDYGAFGLAFKSAVDLRGSYRRVERFGRVVTSLANFEFLEGEGIPFMAVLPGIGDRLGLHMTNELAVSAAIALSREVSGEAFAPARVRFAHAPPADGTLAENHFRCSVNYGEERDGIEVPEALLSLPNRLGDAAISGFFDAHLDRALADSPDVQRLDQQVQSLLSEGLSEGVPSLADMARKLGLSARTLQRRLKASGDTYQDLVDRTRRELAERLLRRTSYSLAEIAFLTGFSEQSTFTRAFGRWTGRTPAQFRSAR